MNEIYIVQHDRSIVGVFTTFEAALSEMKAYRSCKSGISIERRILNPEQKRYAPVYLEIKE